MTSLSLNAAQTADADVLKVEAIDQGGDGWTFNVTVAHPDKGWEDYCNGWNVVTDKGEVLKADNTDTFTRVLFHPHETEQPFTRSQRGLQVPEGTKTLTVRAHDIIHGFGGKEVVIRLASRAGPGYRILR